MIKLLCFFLQVVLVFVFISCSSPEKKVVKKVAAEAIAGDALGYEYKVVEEESSGCAEEENPYCAKAYLRYPVLDSASSGPEKIVQEQINQLMTGPFMEEEKFADPSAVVNGFIKAYQITLEQNKDYVQPWQLERKAEVYANTDSLFGIRFSEYLNMGGAHPISVLYHKNFNPETGKLIPADSLFNDKEWGRLLQKGEAKFRALQGLAANESFETAGYWFRDNWFYLPDNYQLTPDSIIFYFNPYEIAPHAVGLIRIPLEKNEQR